jgi:hypothetical protein
VQLNLAAASRTFCTAGNNNPIRIAMIAITTKSSIRVKAFLFIGRILLKSTFKLMIKLNLSIKKMLIYSTPNLNKAVLLTG